jgi:hypothetical protein
MRHKWLLPAVLLAGSVIFVVLFVKRPTVHNYYHPVAILQHNVKQITITKLTKPAAIVKLAKRLTVAKPVVAQVPIDTLPKLESHIQTTSDTTQVNIAARTVPYDTMPQPLQRVTWPTKTEEAHTKHMKEVVELSFVIIAVGAMVISACGTK